MKIPSPVLIGLALLLGAASCYIEPETKVDPEAQLDLYRELALRWYQMNELDRAEEQVVKALDLAPEDHNLLLMRGFIRQRRGTRDDILIAEQIFRGLAESNDYRVSLGLAAALERKGLLYFEAAEGAEQDTSTTAERAGELRSKAARAWSESIQEYRETLARSSGNARALAGLQRVYSHTGEYKKSLHFASDHRKVVTTELDFYERQLAVPELSANEEESLLDDVRQSQDALIANLMHAAPLCMRLERPDRALELLNGALELDPDRSDAYGLRAQVLFEKERYADALESVDQFLALSTELDFDHPDIRRAYVLRSQCEHELQLAEAAAIAADAETP